MSVEDLLKQPAVDEAQRKAPPAAATAPVGALLIEATDGHQSNFMSPLGVLVSPGNTVMVPIDIHADIDGIMSANSVQIGSPRRIEKGLLQPFERGLKEVTLVSVQNKLVLPARLESIRDPYLVVHTQHATNFRRRGNLLMLIPACPQKRYVLQLTVEEVGAHRLVLRCQDPRYDVRRQVHLAAPVLLRLPPPTLLPRLRQQQVSIMRHITLPPEESPRTTPVRLADQLYDMAASEPSSSMHQLEQTLPLSCRLQDISLGGSCLKLPGKLRPEAFAGCLILLHIPLPPLPTSGIDWQNRPVHLDLLGVARGVSTTARSSTLHTRFLRRLPKPLLLYLAELERGFLVPPPPLP